MRRRALQEHVVLPAGELTPTQPRPVPGRNITLNGPMQGGEARRRRPTGRLCGDELAVHRAARMNDFCWRLFDGDIHAKYPGS